ncbi:ORF6N domain-containing protein [Acinetobacter baumannii]|uniref:ORF6N domain-containing protein n=1 Tax=Acinetobacter baumannii TaxID=470 RepID=UPI001CAA5CED|nr:ORF6N domain-containing protein [Acinetobacter baumannii]MBZ0351375.1 ORF6N domain-containing protein [Acinetobacter baumannii]MBZ0381489.1 ORF6N domain-containing protein [Acinetobacter baumannii]MBZ0399002.1 ORF6N domain-containing protein [Acinetobacter baumannii]MBZ0401317.1 ORF6N domain-containing protein [Acinetobacter baumannii]MBZ0409200.1 ORF6N domain-containing protein [Acinetobacter baumannii]
MSNIAQINDTKISIVNFKSVPVVTTAMLADFYGTDTDNIKQNYSRNKERFVEGKHFFKIIGEELKKFVGDLKSLANFPAISNKTRSLILWTERGAARHAKMLDTDQAWEVFEQLEDCYFVRKEILAKTHKSEREPLTNAVNLLVAKTKHLNYSDAYKLVHQRFNVQHIDEIPHDVIPVAVEYVHHLIAMYSNAEKYKDTEPHIHTVLRDKNVQFLMWYVPILAKFIKNEISPALIAIQSSYAGRLFSLAQESVTHANVLNRKALGYGITRLEHVDYQPVHTIEWYLSK